MEVTSANQEKYKQALNSCLDKLKNKVDEIVEIACAENAKCCGVDINIMLEPGRLVRYAIKYDHNV